VSAPYQIEQAGLGREPGPDVGTHLAGAARDKAQAEALRLQLVE
jgi:hypothetical protein